MPSGPPPDAWPVGLRRLALVREIEAARAFAADLAARGDEPPDGPWPQAQALRAVLDSALREALPPPAREADDWARRVARLAERPWLGGCAWYVPAGWLALLERAVAQAERWSQGPERAAWRTFQVKEKFGPCAGTSTATPGADDRRRRRARLRPDLPGLRRGRPAARGRAPADHAMRCAPRDVQRR